MRPPTNNQQQQEVHEHGKAHRLRGGGAGKVRSTRLHRHHHGRVLKIHTGLLPGSIRLLPLFR